MMTLTPFAKLTPQNCLRSLKAVKGWPIWWGLGAAVIVSLPARGAERMQFFYGPFELTIRVDDLAAIATAENPATVDAPWIDQLNDADLATLQTILNQRLAIDVVTLSQFSYSHVGENLLSRVGQIVQTETGLNGAQALRSALILAAADDQGLSLINIIHHFPLDTIQLDWPLVQKILAENQAIFQKQGDMIADLQQQAQVSTEPRTLPVADLSEQGNYHWHQAVITFINPQRSAPSIADLYMPQNAAGSVPVIVISHGMAANRQTFVYLAEHLASHGYAVVAIDHVDTNTEKFHRFLTGLEGAPDPQSLLHRPRDVSAVLDTLATKARAEGEWRSLDLDSVGVIGHSLGGYTALATGGATLQPDLWQHVCSETVAEQPLLNLSMLLQCRFDELTDEASLIVQDDRVQAVMAMNPLTSHLFGVDGMASLAVPTMLIAGTDDYFVPALPEQIEPFQWLTVEDKYLVIIEDGTHFTPMESDQQVIPVPDVLIGPDPVQAQPALRSLSLAFFDRHLRNQEDRDAYLTQTYLNSLNDGPFQFSIVR
ncbi:MAG: alpha/beta fold hydrolase [Leptolyngbya sp. SIOISBB]|nr:alpha/beta fold hydrolase [Leptolyngbya sp. SIOISBB]